MLAIARWRAIALLIAAGAHVVSDNRAAAVELSGGFVHEVVAGGFEFPTAMLMLPDGRMLVAEKAGLVWVVENGTRLAAPFADFRSRVNNFWDRGLTGIAIDPGFTANQYIYFFYPYDIDGTDSPNATTGRLTRVTADGNVMRAGSEIVILGSQATPCGASPHPDCIPQDGSSDAAGHAVNTMQFASDGTLFVSLGDSASWNFVDPLALRAQDINQYPGKVLRLSLARCYAASTANCAEGIANNPYWTGTAADIASKVWARGFRNPFRMALQPATDVPLIGDVGWNDWEEINAGEAGANYGWPCYEGNGRQSGYAARAECQALYAQGASAVKAPLIAYAHGGPGGAVVQGPFTPSSSGFPPQYHNGFFYADYALDWIRFAQLDASNNVVNDIALATQTGGPVDLHFGADGHLYYVAVVAGELRRIRPGTSGGFVYLSDLPTSATPVNGWGPFERDRANGEDAANDGQTLAINGAAFVKGLGVHAASELSFAVPAGCHTFLAQVGVDDEVSAGDGSVVFEVWNGTAARLYQSAVMTGAMGASAVPPIDVSAIGTLRLIVAPTADGDVYDHADWGDAKFACASGGPPPPPGGGNAKYLSDLPTTGTVRNAWGPFERDRSNGESGTNDGGPLRINGVTYAKGLGVHALSELTFSVPPGCTTFLAHVGIDDEIPATQGSVTFEVWNGTSARLYSSPVLTGAMAATAVSVPLSGVSALRLRVTPGASNSYDHADWGDAKFSCGGGGNTPPVATITSPGAQPFRVGDTIALSGSATDAEDGAIPSANLSWQVNLHHCPGSGGCHVHPFASYSGANASFTAPDHEDGSFLEIRLTAIDSGGLTATATRNLQPQTVTLTFQTNPAGLQLQYGSGPAEPTPFQRVAMVGGTRTIGAPGPQGGRVFTAWSDGGAQQHNITVPAANTTYTATFAAPAASTVYLSDLPTTGTVRNAWGPFERDRSNGESGATDGGPLRINGTTYTKGLGVHALSELTFAVPSGCTTFLAEVGVDDEIATTQGSVTFEVWNGTATRLYASPIKTGAMGATAVSVPLSGVSLLRLRVTPGSSNTYDHADWGDAKLSCGG